MLWEVDIHYRNSTPDGTNLRVLVSGPTVSAVTERCHRTYPTGRIDCIFRSSIEEICPGLYVTPERGESND